MIVYNRVVHQRYLVLRNLNVYNSFTVFCLRLTDLLAEWIDRPSSNEVARQAVS